MTTISEAIAAMGLTPDDDHARRGVVRIPQGRKPVHATVTDVGGRVVEDIIDDLYHTLARYKPGTIHAGGGRTRENAVSVDMLPFDADLKDYLGLPLEVLHTTPHAELDAYISSLVKDVQEAFDRAGVPIHRIDCTGYGIAVYVRLHRDDQRRLDEAAHIQKSLIGRINGGYGGVLVDPAVSDPATRFMRVVGSQNHKGPHPRTVYTLWEQPGACRLDDFTVAPAPLRREQRPVAEKVLDGAVLDEIVLALANEYHEGIRNVIAYSLPAMFCKAGVPCEQCHEVIDRLGVDDPELDARHDAVDRTYDKWESGSSVSGYHALANSLSVQVRDFVSDKLRRFTQTIIIDDILEEAPLLQPTVQAWGNIYDPPPPVCYYGWFGKYRALMAPCTSGADAFHLASTLIYGGATIGKRARIYHVGDHYPNLMAVLVGDTNDARKTTCARLARDTFAKQDVSGDDLLTLTPTPYNVMTDLSTAEGLLQFLNDNGPRAVIHTNEFDILLGKARRESGHGLLPRLTQLWDSEPYIDLPTRKDPIRITNPFISLLATTTPVVLSEEATVADIRSGFSNRVLWVYGSGKGFLPTPPRPDEAERQRLIRDFMDAVQQACGQGRELRLTPRAAKRFAEWAREVSDNGRYLNADEKHLSVRLESNALRIALIFAVSDGEGMIDVPHLESAIAFMEWQFENVRKESRMWGASGEARLGELILSLLRHRPLSRSELYDRLQRWGATAIKRAMDALREMDKIIESPKSGLIHATTPIERRAG
jgi:hypothetical protein